MTMDSSDGLNIMGLVMNIVGAFVMYKNSQPVTFETFIYCSGNSEKRKRKAKRMNRNERFGLILLVIGIVFQLNAIFD